MRVFALLFAIIGSTCSPTWAADPFGQADQPVKATLIADVDAVTPGETFHVGLLFKIKPHWHTYWIHPGDAGMPTSVKFSTPGLNFKPVRWPLPTKFLIDGFINLGYENEVLHLIPVTAAPSLKDRKSITVTVKAEWLACKDICLASNAQLKLTLPIRDKSAPANTALFKKWKARLPIAANSKTAKAHVASIEQTKTKTGRPKPSFTVTWQKGAMPKDVRWHPIPTSALAIKTVKLTSQQQTTTVTFEPEIYSPDDLGDGRIGGMLIFKNKQGREIGIPTPLHVAGEK